MKLTCSVSIIDATVGSSSRVRPKTGIAVLFRSGSTVQLKISFKDSTVAFELFNNVNKVYDKYMHEGNLTVKLKNPDKYLMVKRADPAQLSRFSKLLQLAACGKQLPEQVLTKTNVSVRELSSTVPWKLHIARREDYPVGQSFPPNLMELLAQSLKLRAFDERLLKLDNLRHLDLGANLIQSIPRDIQLLGLIRLSLDANRLTEWPTVDRDSQLARSLQFLSLSGNPIKWLPDDFWNLDQLMSVNLSSMGLRGIPAANLHRLSRLNDLKLDNNQLTCLPYAMSLHKYCRLSVCGNTFVRHCPDLHDPLPVRSLFDHASLVCSRTLNLNVFRELLPWHLAIRFDVFRPCLRCRKPCGLEPTRTLVRYPGVSGLTRDPQSNEPSLLAYVCSAKCVRLYQKRPGWYDLS